MSFKPTPSQEKALSTIKKFINEPCGNKFSERVLVVTGQAGTGKTTILKFALEKLIAQDLRNSIYKEEDFFSDFMNSIPNVMGVTISHKAKLRLQESIPNASTYAAFFGLKPVYDFDGSISFEKQHSLNSKRILPHQLPFIVVVHDEVSMYDMHYLKFIEEHTQPGTKIILVGDPSQLPPITKGNVKTDLDSPSFTFFKNVVKLEERVRQTVGNPILDLATAIHEEIFGGKNIQRILQIINEDKFSDGIGYRKIQPTELVKDYLSTYAENDQTRVICYRNKKIDLINNLIRKKMFEDASSIFVEGDALYMNQTYINKEEVVFYNSEEFRIRAISEVYVNEVHCYKAQVKGDPSASIFLVSEIGQKVYKNKMKELKNKAINADFRYKSKAWEKYYDFRDLYADVSYGYAFTAYKAQGSGFKNVYVDVNDILTTPISDKRKLQTLYTAVTRATHQVIFF